MFHHSNISCTQCIIFSTFKSFQTSYWGDCSKTCNGGFKRRNVRCVQRSSGGIEFDVDSSTCAGLRPADTEGCNKEPCPAEWIAQPFGEVCFTSLISFLSAFFCKGIIFKTFKTFIGCRKGSSFSYQVLRQWYSPIKINKGLTKDVKMVSFGRTLVRSEYVRARFNTTQYLRPFVKKTFKTNFFLIL